VKLRTFDKDREDRRERRVSPKEKLLLDTLRYWGFHQAAANLDCQRERIDLDAAIASWNNYPKCLDEYPTVITKKVKLDAKELAE
jgi:hypothetical protein